MVHEPEKKIYSGVPNMPQTALTTADNTTINAVFDAVEEAVLNNVRTRINELETRLQALELLL